MSTHKQRIDAENELLARLVVNDNPFELGIRDLTRRLLKTMYDAIWRVTDK